MRAAVAALLALSVSTSACFPDNEKHRTIAKITEGGLMLGGVVTLAFVNTTADCDADTMLGMDEAESCSSRADLISNIGLAALLIGLVGFIVTVSAEPDDDKPATPAEPKTITKPATTPVPAEPVAQPTAEPATP